MSTHQDKSLETFNDRLREVATELHDTGGHYLLNDEQLAAITAAAQKYADERELMLMERLLHVEEIYDDGDEQQCVWTINTTDLHHAAKAVADRLRKGAS